MHQILQLVDRQLQRTGDVWQLVAAEFFEVLAQQSLDQLQVRVLRGLHQHRLDRIVRTNAARLERLQDAAGLFDQLGLEIQFSCQLVIAGRQQATLIEALDQQHDDFG